MSAPKADIGEAIDNFKCLIFNSVKLANDLSQCTWARLTSFSQILPPLFRVPLCLKDRIVKVQTTLVASPRNHMRTS